MLNKLNNIINSSILTSILLLIIGIATLMFPKISIDLFSFLLGAILMVKGLYLLLSEMTLDKRHVLIDSSMSGVVLLILGLILLIYPKTLSIVISIILGVWFISSSIVKLRMAIALRNDINTPWVISLIMSILAIICGIILIINPSDGSLALTMFIGGILVIYAISDIIEMFVLKRYINKIVKYFDEI